jgi:hypothetical protein
LDRDIRTISGNRGEMLVTCPLESKMVLLDARLKGHCGVILDSDLGVRKLIRIYFALGDWMIHSFMQGPLICESHVVWSWAGRRDTTVQPNETLPTYFSTCNRHMRKKSMTIMATLQASAK